MITSAPSTTTPARRRRALRAFVGRHKALAVLCATALVLLGITVAWVGTVNSRLGDIPRFDAGLERPGRIERVPGEALNILLVGVDEGRGTRVGDALSSGTWVPGTFRSDTMMLWHLSADRQESQVVSLPRDSWVEIPGHGAAKLNAAFSYGGPPLLVHTLEDTFGVYIDHVAVIDFVGFKDLTETLDGVDVRLIDGSTERLEGEEALAYVRARTSLPEGDFDRIQRQQHFLRSVLEEVVAKETRLNPIRITEVAGDLSQLAVLDSNLTNGKLRGIALDLARNGGGRITWLTVPHHGTGVIEGQSIVRLNIPETRQLFKAIAEDRFDEYRERNPVSQLPAPGHVD